MSKAKQKKVDKSLDMTFPASDPPASRRATGTETPGRPSDRHAPVISKDEIEAAAGDAGRQGRRAGPRRQQGPSRDGHTDAGGVDGNAEEHEGVAEKPRGGRE
jgi:hypothetical protein